MASYFRRIFSIYPSASGVVFTTLLPTLLAGIATVLGSIPWTPPSTPDDTVVVILPSPFLTAIESQVSRILSVWISTHASVPSIARMGSRIRRIFSRSGPVRDADSGACQSNSYDGLRTYLLQVLECPVCYEVKRGRAIFQCRNGHNVCGACRPRIYGDKCPMCNAWMTSSRNWLAEDLSLKLAGGPRKDAFQGSMDMVVQDKMTLHLTLCYACLVVVMLNNVN